MHVGAHGENADSHAEQCVCQRIEERVRPALDGETLAVAHCNAPERAVDLCRHTLHVRAALAARAHEGVRLGTRGTRECGLEHDGRAHTLPAHRGHLRDHIWTRGGGSKNTEEGLVTRALLDLLYVIVVRHSKQQLYVARLDYAGFRVYRGGLPVFLAHLVFKRGSQIISKIVRVVERRSVNRGVEDQRNDCVNALQKRVLQCFKVDICNNVPERYRSGGLCLGRGEQAAAAHGLELICKIINALQRLIVVRVVL